METIEIQAKEWFDKTYGNSYFSARVYIDDQQVAILPFQYGYGDHYIDIANQYLIKNDLIKGERHSNGVWPSLWRYCEDHKIKLITFKQEKCLKRDLDKEA